VRNAPCNPRLWIGQGPVEVEEQLHRFYFKRT
jgi:hypothetical protein